MQDEQVKLAKSQTLERYIEKGKTWVDSLQNQAATQMVLINKLQTDTKQRVVLYDALTKSLKTAQQQDVAHRINEIGVETDQEAQAAMSAIGSATNTRMAEMMEAHEDHMVFAREGAGAEGQGGRTVCAALPGDRREARQQSIWVSHCSEARCDTAHFHRSWCSLGRGCRFQVQHDHWVRICNPPDQRAGRGRCRRVCPLGRFAGCFGNRTIVMITPQSTNRNG